MHLVISAFEHLFLCLWPLTILYFCVNYPFISSVFPIKLYLSYLFSLNALLQHFHSVYLLNSMSFIVENYKFLHSYFYQFLSISRFHIMFRKAFPIPKSFLNFFNVYLFLRERERERTSRWRAERDREARNLMQAPGCELSAQSPTWSLNSRAVKWWTEPKSDA